MYIEEMAFSVSRNSFREVIVAFENVWSPEWFSFCKNLIQRFESELKIKYVMMDKRRGTVLTNTSLPIFKSSVLRMKNLALEDFS